MLLALFLLLIDQNILSHDSNFNRPANQPASNTANSKQFAKYKSFLLSNQSGAQAHICRLPRFELEGHEDIETYKPCKQRVEWGYLQSNHWHLNMTVVKPLRALKCQYRAIIRENDFKLTHSPLMNLVDQQLIDEDFIEVVCRGTLYGRKMIFNHVYVQIVPKMNPHLDVSQLNKLKNG